LYDTTYERSKTTPLISGSVYILAIETSCDDTSAAVLHNARVLSNVVANQEVHRRYGGVVPEWASRAHQQHIVPVVHEALRQANIGKKDLSAIAFTKGPGLTGSLLVGLSFAKGMAQALGIPLIGVNHMQGHVLAHFIDDERMQRPGVPFLCLTVSGGHTEIVRVDAPLQMTVLGRTLDDAAGEAFDKTAKLLGLEYPGGPLIDALAKEGNPLRFEFTKPKVQGLDFSFSGLKTGILYFLRKQIASDPAFIEKNLHDLAASVQHTIISILMEKITMAVEQTGISRVAVAGGVSANSEIRRRLERQRDEAGWKVFIPAFEYTTDNAAMIGITGYLKYLEGMFDSMEITARSRMHISEC